MAGLFAVESPAYLGQGQNASGGDRGGGFGIFPSTPKYEQAAPAQAPATPDGKTVQVKIVVPGVLAVECALTPETIAALASMTALAVRTLVQTVAAITRPEQEETEPTSEERERPETEERVWDRE